MLRCVLLVAVCAASACTPSGSSGGSATATGHSKVVASTRPSTKVPRTRTTSTLASSPTPPPRTVTSSSRSRTPSRTITPDEPVGGHAGRVLASMSEAERVGQLLMVDCPSTGVSAATATAIRQYHAGSVILDGTSQQGVDGVRAVTRRLQALAPVHTQLLISADQEGGTVQRLQGPGFSSIPSAVRQGQWSDARLHQAATTWADELNAAGVNVDLAPVLDTVPPGDHHNPPIGDLDREYGHNPAHVRRSGLAFLRGMAAGGVDATGKHFPGLGRVDKNTDTVRGVLDRVTTAHDADLRPFAAAVRAGVPLMMVSTAVYTRIDPSAPAAFSSRIVTHLLRRRLGFSGVVISDDLGAAAQVSGYDVGQRAVLFIRAGGDLVLTVDAGQAAAMTSALLATARRSPSFHALVDAAALRVLKAKDARGLLP